MGVKKQSRCGWHCINLDAGGGRCNAIMYNRESKVVFYQTSQECKNEIKIFIYRIENVNVRMRTE